MKTPEFDIKKRTFTFELETVRFCNSLRVSETEFILTKQLIRSATSVGANVRESRNAESKKDFIHKLSIAQKETNESCYWLELLMELYPKQQSQAKELHSESDELLKILSAMIINSKKSM